MSRHCLKWIDRDGTILCHRHAGHEDDPDDPGCCSHEEETTGDGKTRAGRLRRKCLHCGDKFLVSEFVGQQFLREEELCYEVWLIAHSDVTDYVYDDRSKNPFRVREGVNPDATRAISGFHLKRRYDERGMLEESDLKVTFHSKLEAIRMAGTRFNAFPNRFEIADSRAAIEALAKAAGVKPEEIPLPEEAE